MKKTIGLLLLVVLVAVIGFTVMGKRGVLPEQGKGESAVTATRASDRDASDSEREARRKRSLDLAAQKWYEELLEKYPEMKPVYRDVADEKNGYLQLLMLGERMGKLPLSEELKDMISGAGVEWDAGKFEAWRSENQAFFDEVLRIAELPERSTKGIALDQSFAGSGKFCPVFGHILQASARTAFEKGDQETAFRHFKASTSIGDHMVDTEVPSMLSEVISAGIRISGRDLFHREFLPVLANDPEVLNRWNEVVFRNEEPSAEYARVIYGEWNACMRCSILPAFLGDNSADVSMSLDGVPDAVGLIDSYTRIIKNTATGVLHSGSGRFDVREATAAFPADAGPVDRTQGDSRKVTAEGMLVSLRSLPKALGSSATQTAMVSAAVSILRGEEPPVDPVSGEEFVWDAETRTLRTPGGGEESEPIVVPRGNL